MKSNIAIATMMQWRDYGHDQHLERLFSNTVVTIKVSDTPFHISLQMANQPSFVIACNLIICRTIWIMAALQFLLKTDGNATMMQ